MTETDELLYLRRAMTSVWHAIHNPHHADWVSRERGIRHVLNRVAEDYPHALLATPEDDS